MKLEKRIMSLMVVALVVTIGASLSFVGEDKAETSQTQTKYSQTQRKSIETQRKSLETEEKAVELHTSLPPMVAVEPLAYDITQDEAIQELNTLGVFIPDNYVDLCDRAEQEYGVKSELLQAIMWNESRCVPTAENGNCKGLMQCNIKYWSVAGEDWRNPHDAINMGARAIQTIVATYGCEDLGAICTRYHGEQNFDDYSVYTQSVDRIEYLLERSKGE